MAMTDRERMKRFYLTDYDFNLFVNKGCQTYKRTLDEQLADPITYEYYKSLQRGGCNEHHDKCKDRGTNP